MKITHRLSLVSLACVASIQLVHAAPRYDQSNTFYIPVSVGQYFPDSSFNERSSITAGIGLGYNINNYFAVQTDIFGFAPVNRNTNDTIAGYNWDLEGRLNLANASPFMPYVVLGAGVLKNESTQFALDYGVGVDYLAGRDISFGVSFRQAYQFVGSKANNMGLFNLTYTFGHEEVIPKVVTTTSVVLPPPAAPAPIVVVSPLNPTQQAMLKRAQTSLKPMLPNGVVMCKGNMVGNQAGCVTFSGNQMTMHLNVRFMQGQANVQNQFGTPIQSLGSFMHAYPKTKVSLYGYASSEGKPAFNQKLSVQRASQVKQYLVKSSGINASRITVVGMGVKNPIASNKTAVGRAENRRVEAQIGVPTQLISQ